MCLKIMLNKSPRMRGINNAISVGEKHHWDYKLISSETSRKGNSYL